MNCFERLGISTRDNDISSITELEVKKAYRRLARQVHPDMCTDPQEKERANQAFRDLHDTYEEALHRLEEEEADKPTECQSGNSRQNARRRDGDRGRGTSDGARCGRGTSRGDRAATDSEIRSTFSKVCEELKKDSDAEWETRVRDATREAKKAWPHDPERCWSAVESRFIIFADSVLTPELRASDASLFEFLRSRVDQKAARNRTQYEREIVKAIAEANRLWKKDSTRKVKENIQGGTWSIFALDVANGIDNPAAAAAIRAWKAEWYVQVEKNRVAGCQRTAIEIERVFPDEGLIRALLKSHLRWDYKTIYDFLPETIRAKLGPGLFGEKPLLAAQNLLGE